MGYEQIDAKIADWVRRHSLKVHTSWAGDDCRYIYVASLDGDCFKIWIDVPVNEQVGIHAAFVDGPTAEECQRDWLIPEAQLEASLEKFFQFVIRGMKMKPS